MATEFPAWTWVVGFFIGAAFGSFLNMLIHRLPRNLSIVNPPNSFCPRCNHKLGVPDLFPLLSWLFLRGKCRYCKAPISPRYFIVELVNATLWGVLWWQYFIVSWDPAKGIAYALFGSALLVALLTDLELYIIPDEVNAFLLVVGFGYHAIAGTIMTAVWGALTGWAVLWGVALLGRVLFRKDAMGHGDIKMARGMGALLGPVLVVAAFFIAVFVGAIVGVAQIVLRRKAAAQMATDEDEDDTPYEPEPVGLLTKCGIGYLLCLDVVALFVPSLAKTWFEDDPNAQEVEDDWVPEPTAIPFGPYLAVGAVAAAIFAIPLTRIITDYFSGPGGQAAMLEHLFLTGGPKIV